MRHRDGQPGLIGQCLQLALPQAHPRATATAAVGGDQDAAGRLVARLSNLLPPPPDAFQREGRSIVVDAQIDPSGVGHDVIDPVGRNLAQFGNDEIMHPDRFWIALWTQLTPCILEVFDKLLLLRVNRDGRLPGGPERLDPGVDVFKLRVAVRMVVALAGLFKALN